MHFATRLTRRAMAAAFAGAAVVAALAVGTPASAAPANDQAAAIQETPPFVGAPRLAGAAAPEAAGLGPSARLCGGHAIEYGDWRNANPATRSITRAQLRDCQSVTVCNGNICSIAYDAGWSMRLFGSCSPTDCDWGWSAGKFRLSTGQIPAYYDQGFAKEYVWAAMSAYRPGQLWIAVRTDFVDPNRADMETQDWFVRS